MNSFHLYFTFYCLGISPQSTYDLPENVTPILDSEQDILFNKLKEQRKEPVIKLHRLTEMVRWIF